MAQSAAKLFMAQRAIFRVKKASRVPENIGLKRISSGGESKSVNVLGPASNTPTDEFMEINRPLVLCLLGFAWVAIRGQCRAAESGSPANAPVESQPSTPEARIDALFKEWDTTTTPGASVTVIRHGNVVFEKGYGVANLEYGIPIKPETVFHVASVSKQFTAMAVVLLEGDGKLSIDDDVRKYLPELPDYGWKITLRNLLQHSSGIRDQWQTLALAGWSLEDVITQDQILRLLFRQKELNFPPGTAHLYSNGAFTLLAEIVTRVSGEPFPKFCAERIFIPLGMAHTHFHQDLTQLVSGRAYSYMEAGKSYAAAPLNFANVGATSLFTTADDLVRWLDNFRTFKIGGAAAVARLQEPCVLADGSRFDYGLGLGLGNYRGLPILWHNGGDAGYRSDVMWFPQQELGIAVLGNAANLYAEGKAQKIAAVFLDDEMKRAEAKQPKTERKYVEADPKQLEQYVGTYLLPFVPQIFRIFAEKGKLWGPEKEGTRFELRPVAPGKFYMGEIDADIEFVPKPGGGMRMRVLQPGFINEGDRVEAGEAETDLPAYSGVYWSEELETQYTFFVRDGTLFGLHARHGEFALVPAFKDYFTSDEWFTPTLRFFRDANGRVTSVRMGGGRVTGVLFARKPGGVLQRASLRSVPASNPAVASIVGRYDYHGPILTVTADGGHIFAQLGVQPKFEIFAKTDTEYFWKVVDARVTFERDPSGKVVSATHEQNGHTFSAPRIQDVAEISLSEAQAAALVGDYDVGGSVKMTISRDAGRLYTQLTGQPKFELGARSDTEFFLRQWNAQLSFIKDQSGKVTGVISHQNGQEHNWPRLATP